MNRTYFHIAAMIFAVTFGLSLVAGATEGGCANEVSEAAKPEAARLVAQGKAALQAARYGDALRAFQQAYCVAPVVTINHPLSAAALNLGRCGEAVEHAKFWTEHADPKALAEAKRWLHEVKAQCIEVAIQSSPSGASVLLDGAKGDTRVTPWRGFVRAGLHPIVATKTGFFQKEAEVTIPPGERREPFEISLTLLEQPRVSTEPGVVAITAPASPPVDLSPPARTTTELTPAPLGAAARRQDSATGHTLGIVGTVLGVVGLAAGTVLGVFAQQQATAARNTPTSASVESRVSGVNNLVSGAIGGWAAGGALAVTGVGLLVAF